MVGKRAGRAGARPAPAAPVAAPPALVEALAPFGFAEYDVRAYTALLERQPATAYEVARGAGIADSKIYRVLERLSSRGVVLRLEREPATFAALPPDALLGRLDASARQGILAARRALEGVAHRESPVGAWPLPDGPAVLARAAALLAAARARVDLACGAGPLAALAGGLAEARERGVEVAVLPPAEGRSLLVLLADGAEAVVARLASAADGRLEGRGLASREPAILDLAAETLGRRRGDERAAPRPSAREGDIAPGRLDIC